MDHPLDGLLVVDKPVGPTSHDVVSRVRRTLGEKRIGHTGTLDPAASGVLALVVGRATRLAQFMAADEKQYEARVRLGVETDTYDAEGSTVGTPFQGPWPARDLVVAAIKSFEGNFLQRPPAYSAKKIAGRRSYQLARAQKAGTRPDQPEPAPVAVTLRGAAVTGYADGVIDLQLDCSAGFYVRALAHDIGERLGTGAHLMALRRTRSGSSTLAEAVPLAVLEESRQVAAAALRPMATLLPSLPALVLTETGARRTLHGVTLGPDDVEMHANPAPVGPVRLFSSAGSLLAIARPTDRPGFFHPAVVLV